MDDDPRGTDDRCCCDQLHLTSREVDVLVEVAVGRDNSEIAAALSISKDTAAHHVANMLRRTRVRNRTELVAWAFITGVLSPGAWPPTATHRRCVGAFLE